LTRTVHSRPDQVRMRKRSTIEIKRLIQTRARGNNPSSGFTPQSHHIHHYLHLIAGLGGNPEPLPPKLEVTAREIKQAEETCLSKLPPNSAAGSDQPPILLGLNPGAEYGPAKRWPAENFAATAREVSRRRGNCTWLAFGASTDSELCDEISRIAGVPFLNLAGKTSLRELMALLKIC